jgi:hypothetical protein
MESRNKVRVGLIAVGMAAAALVFCGTTKAQEITNARFSDGPNVVAFESTASQVTANSSVSSAATSSQSAAKAMDSAALNDAAARQDSYNRGTSMLIWGGAGLVWIGAVGLYAGGPAKRFTEKLRAMRKQYAADPTV